MASTDAGSGRGRLSPERVLRAAVALADAGGIESLTMRRLGQDLGVEAMSLYKHVANKEALLDGMVDLVFAEIELPAATHATARALPCGATSTQATATSECATTDHATTDGAASLRADPAATRAQRGQRPRAAAV